MQKKYPVERILVLGLVHRPGQAVYICPCAGRLVLEAKLDRIDISIEVLRVRTLGPFPAAGWDNLQ